ncbi:MAG: mandelate racemase/muconate lactonizing enzyme family protein [Kiritimatiellae bacterium]|nr:mandelate racemase/muconate lactonizing enzyme family protein [Kiritimatiellia bacterium]MDD5522728.1 mandelate racemase/muconate lactonizing enzyme family protein [Kiritimatiellia bacterium]
MNKITRRSFLGNACAVSMAGITGRLTAQGAIITSSRQTDIAIKQVSFNFEEYSMRTPLKFGGTVINSLTLLNAECTVETKGGKVARGFGSMPLGNTWSFPSKAMTYSQTLTAMKKLAERISKITSEYGENGHPVDINWVLEPEYLKAATAVTRELELAEPMPKLCTLVVASPFDAAIHDAFGKVHGRSSYQTYGPDMMGHDLSTYLGSEFKGEYLEKYVQPEPKPAMPLYHLVGAVDPLEESDIKKRIDDGLPETLSEWINYNGLTHIKIKLNGNDLAWDVERVVRIDRVTTETQKKRGMSTWFYSLDFNEKCPNVTYLLDFLKQVKEKTSAGFDRIQYIEQPTARDLKANRLNVMHEASKLRPIVIDESLTDQENLMLAREIGYTGTALKACKGQSQALLMAAVAQKYKMFLCVQDLTCPGASLIHSAGLAAHVPGVTAIEANARQFLPAANKPWEKKFPGIFIITNGMMKTAVLNQPGLGAV